ncbi:hypothetical protein [Methanoregula sp.]|jgi:hypothetical protein|uniref:hypothetical protein n=1 Tax=Methanoregula sp. TaxID=2052170 RepID=UPI003C772320
MSGRKNQKRRKEPVETWLKSLNLSQEDNILGLRLESGENIEREIKVKDNWIRYSIEPFGLRDLSKDPDSYQKLINDIDAVIRKNILEWNGKKGSTSPRIRSRKVVLGGFTSRQCSRCLSLNPPYVKYCANCGARFV